MNKLDVVVWIWFAFALGVAVGATAAVFAIAERGSHIARMQRHTSKVTASELAAWIERCGFTQREACKRLGVAQRTLTRQLCEGNIPETQALLMEAIDGAQLRQKA
jgi:hypothetical protein